MKSKRVYKRKNKLEKPYAKTQIFVKIISLYKSKDFHEN